MLTLSVSIQKGGVGKTTTASVIAAGIARRGFRVVTIDADPQKTLTNFTCIEPVHGTLLDVITGAPVQNVIYHTAQGFDIIPGALALSDLPKGYNIKSLQAVIKALAPSYDYCVIDTPPALSMLTMSALAASDGVIIPACADAANLYALDQLQETLQAVRAYNPALQLTGIVLTQYNPRTNLERALKDAISKKAGQMGSRVFDQTIRRGIAIKEAQLLKQDIFTYAPRSPLTADYSALVDEILKGAVNNG